MSIVIGVDCGINHCGVGVFDSAPESVTQSWLLKRAFLAKPWPVGDVSQMSIAERVRAMALGVTRALSREELTDARLAVEWPVIYPGPRGRKKGNPNVSIVPLCAVAAAIAALLSHLPVTTYEPREWKGSIDGEKFIRTRIRPALYDFEERAFEPCAASLKHNVYDGVGVALKAVGRLERHRVIPR